MSRKEGFCDSCQQNKAHRRVAGVFSLVNLVLLGLPSVLGISTWQCTHCRSLRMFLVRQREVSKSLPASSFRKTSMHQPEPSSGLKSETREKATPEKVNRPKIKSTRSRLYSEKYRDGVARRVVSGITSIKEVQESLELSESDVVEWVKQSFVRKEDRVELLQETLIVYQRNNPGFDGDQLIADVKEIVKAKPAAVRSSGDSHHIDRGPMQRTFNHVEPLVDSVVPNEG